MTKRWPLVSIIVVNYNGKKHLKRCFDSLNKTNYPKNKLEIIMVDNCSTDGSIEFVKERCPKIKIIHNDINNYCKANNLGIKISKGEYVALINNDIKVDKAWLIELVKVILQDEAIAAVGSKILGMDRRIQSAGHYELPNFYWGERGAGQGKERYTAVEEVPSLSGAAILCRKRYLQEIGLFDEDFMMYGEDVDMSLRFKKRGWKLLFVPASIIYHKFHGTGNEELARFYIERNRLLFIAKHYPYKLSNALFGSGYFTASKDTAFSGKIYSLIPEIIVKLIKYHPIVHVKEILSEILEELKNISNYECNILQERINEKSKEYAELLIKFESLEQNLNQHLSELKHHLVEKDCLLAEKNRNLANLREELAALSNQLLQRMDEILLKDGQLIEKDKEISKLKDGLENLNDQLSWKKDELAQKDQDLTNYKKELKLLSNQLRQRMDEILLKDGQLIEKDKEISKLKDGLENLNDQLSWKKDELAQKDQDLTNYKKELELLSNQLRQRMDEILLKDGQLIEKDQLLSQKENILSEREEEIRNLRTKLDKIHNFLTFRFIWRPLKKIIFRMNPFLRLFKRLLSKVLWITITTILTPVYILLRLFFLLEYIAWCVFRPLFKKLTPKREVIPFKDLKVSLVMPNWNGIDCLKECLPSIFKAEGFKNGESEVLVVDDGSTDESINYIKSNFPQVRLILNKKNRGFGFSCNRGVAEAKNELVVLINNDIIVTENFLKPLIRHFEDENVFAVTPKLYGWDRKTFLWGMHMGRFEEGYIRLWNEADTGNGDRISQTSPSIFAIGGALIFRKRDFLWLGGFDEIYRPNCWEDIDISYQALKRGLKVLYEPSSLLYHKGKATLTYERHKEIKNELSFTWKNITDSNILKEHLNLLTWNLYRFKMPFLKGFFWALRYLPLTLLHRFRNRRFMKSSDKKIFNRCMVYYRNFERNDFKHRRIDEKKNILLITPFMPYPLTNGAKIRIHTLAKLLSHRYNIILLTLIHHEDETRFIPQLKNVFNEVYAIHPKSPIPNPLFPSRYRFSYSQALIEKFKEIQKTKPIDLVQIESNELLYLVDFVKFIPIIYTEHDVSLLFFKKSYYKRKEGTILANFCDYLKRVYFHIRIYKKLDKIITLSKKDEEILRTFFPQANFSFIPTGVDLERFSYGKKSTHSKSLIFIGHYLHYPNEDTVIYFTKKIFPLIRKRFPQAKFLIVGSDLTERVKELSNQPNVEVIGHVDSVKSYLEDSAVFINSMRTSAGIKGKVLEAMAVGVPVVSTAVGAYGIEAKNIEEIILADGPRKFAKQVLRLLRDEELYSRIAINARKLVEGKYDWLKIVDELDNVYKEMIHDFEKRVEEVAEPSLLDQILDKTKHLVEESIENAYLVRS